MFLCLLVFGSLAAPRPARANAGGNDYLASLIHDAHARRLADSRDWQVLLHYRATLLGGWKSDADGNGFFLAGPRGKTDPAAELDATLAAFFGPPARNPQDPDTQHAQCRFPARYAWLRGALAIDPRQLVDQPCPLFDTWRTGISAEAVTVTYATAYLNSPASMYGHTFFRLSRATDEGNPLLDYAVNFAADVNTTNGLVYAFRGVTGGFPGRFYVVPYYVKVQEYSNMESRDLWEYELALTRAQVDRLVMHAWETARNTYFDYYFFTENCSYQLLTLLEAADPSLHLVDSFGGRVIPSDTVRVILEQPGLVRRIGSRPSLLSTLVRRKASLDGREVQAVEAWVGSAPGAAAPDMTGVPAPRQAQVIDAAFDYLRYREGGKAGPSDAFKKQERRMLLARGRLGVPPHELEARPEIDAPERGHPTLRLGVGGGVSDQAGGFETVSLRMAIHDYLDPARGYPEDAELEMAHVRVRFDNDARRARLDRVDLVNILSASPVDRWVHSFSWKAWIGVENARELGCEQAGAPDARAGWRCLYFGLSMGSGFAVRFGPGDRVLMFILAETDAGAGPAFGADHDYRLGAGGEVGVTAEAGALWRFQVGARSIYYVLGDRRANLRARAAQSFSIGRGLALRLGVETAGSYAQAATELVGYF